MMDTVNGSVVTNSVGSRYKFRRLIMEQFDVLVVGSGGAGQRAALEAAHQEGLKVALITKMLPDDITAPIATPADATINTVRNLATLGAATAMQ